MVSEYAYKRDFNYLPLAWFLVNKHCASLKAIFLRAHDLKIIIRQRMVKIGNNTKSGINALLFSEVYTAKSYLERLFHAALDVSNLRVHKDLQRIIATFNFELEELLDSTALLPHQDWEEVTSDPHYFRETLQSIAGILEHFCKLPVKQDILIKKIVPFINLFYKYARDIHLFLKETDSPDVQFPRVQLGHSKETSDEDNTVPLFQINTEDFKNLSKEKGHISSLKWQREKNYKKYLQEGHKAVFEKKYQEALNFFEKACNYFETAEVLTLIAWSYSFLKKLDKAKSYCLRAINLNPNYGPPYNDMGSYLISEGKTEESLKWFDLAKKASEYQNKEYPYINSGRIYLSRKKFSKALEEFSMALSIAPFHKELHQTVLKLKKSLTKEKSSKSEPKEELPPSIF